MNAPIRHSNFIGELCIALAHRWEPDRLFMIFDAYFDESDAHGPAPNLIVATYLGSARQWRQFERRLRRIQREFGFDIFHGKELRHGQGQFRGWSDSKKESLGRALVQLVTDELTAGIITSLNHDRYIREYRNTPTPKGMTLDSQYGLCFRGCMGQVVTTALAKHQRPKINVIIESGHRNVGDALRIFKETKEIHREQGIDVLREITIADKRDAAPLMVADMLAYTMSLVNARIRAGRLTLNAIAKGELPEGGVTGLAYVDFLPGALVAHKQDFEIRRAQKRQASSRRQTE